MREKHFSQVSGAAGGDGRQEEGSGGDGRGGEGRLGIEDERQDTKERLGVGEDQRLSRRGENGKESERNTRPK